MPSKVHSIGVGEMDGRVERRGEESKDRGEKEEIRGKARGLKASLEEQEEEQLETNARREGEVRQSAGQHQRESKKT